MFSTLQEYIFLNIALINSKYNKSKQYFFVLIIWNQVIKIWEDKITIRFTVLTNDKGTHSLFFSVIQNLAGKIF